MADDDLAFDPAGCAVDPVTRIPCGNMLTDPTVADAPAAIPDCPDATLEPLAPPPPCPTITAAVTVTEDLDRTGGTALTVTQGDCCDYNLDLDLHIPCPLIQVTGGGDSAVKFTSDPGNAKYWFTRANDACEYTFGIAIDVHCPQISSTSPFLVVDPVNDCDYVISLDPDGGGGGGGFPCDCPDLISFVINQPIFYSDDDAGYITLIIIDGGFYIDLVLPCPVITPIVVTTSDINFASGTPGTLIYYFEKSGCAYDLYVEVIAPCPNIQPQTETVRSIHFIGGIPGLPGTLTYGFTKGANCAYTLAIEVVVPCPAIKPSDSSVTIDIGLENSDVGHLTYYFTRSSECDWTLTIEASAPCPPFLPSDADPAVDGVCFLFDPGNPDPVCGVLTYHFQKTPNCEYLLEIAVSVPCPQIGPTTTVTKPVNSAPPATPPALPIGSLTYYFTKFQCTYELFIDVVAPPKDAIVPYHNPALGRDEYVALTCVEMPEARFEDVVVVAMRGATTYAGALDPVFFAVCEPRTITAVAALPSCLAVVAARVAGNALIVETDRPVETVTVTVSGLRKGMPWRFRRHTRDEMNANNRFWRSWRDNPT